MPYPVFPYTLPGTVTTAVMVSEVNSSLCYTQQFTPSLLEWLLNNSLGLLGVKRDPSIHKLLFKVGGIVKRTTL